MTECVKNVFVFIGFAYSFQQLLLFLFIGAAKWLVVNQLVSGDASAVTRQKREDWYSPEIDDGLMIDDGGQSLLI